MCCAMLQDQSFRALKQHLFEMYKFTRAENQLLNIWSSYTVNIFSLIMLTCTFTSFFQCLLEPFTRSLSSYHFQHATSPFDRRITCLEWHPTHHTTMAVGSKGGDIYLWDFEVPTKKTFIKGVSSAVMVMFVWSHTWIISVIRCCIYIM